MAYYTIDNSLDLYKKQAAQLAIEALFALNEDETARFWHTAGEISTVVGVQLEDVRAACQYARENTSHLAGKPFYCVFFSIFSFLPRKMQFRLLLLSQLDIKQQCKNILQDMQSISQGDLITYYQQYVQALNRLRAYTSEWFLMDNIPKNELALVAEAVLYAAVAELNFFLQWAQKDIELVFTHAKQLKNILAYHEPFFGAKVRVGKLYAKTKGVRLHSMPATDGIYQDLIEQYLAEELQKIELATAQCNAHMDTFIQDIVNTNKLYLETDAKGNITNFYIVLEGMGGTVTFQTQSEEEKLMLQTLSHKVQRQDLGIFRTFLWAAAIFVIFATTAIISGEYSLGTFVVLVFISLFFGGLIDWIAISDAKKQKKENVLADENTLVAYNKAVYENKDNLDNILNGIWANFCTRYKLNRIKSDSPRVVLNNLDHAFREVTNGAAKSLIENKWAESEIFNQHLAYDITHIILQRIEMSFLEYFYFLRLMQNTYFDIEISFKQIKTKILLNERDILFLNSVSNESIETYTITNPVNSHPQYTPPAFATPLYKEVILAWAKEKLEGYQNNQIQQRIYALYKEIEPQKEAKKTHGSIEKILYYQGVCLDIKVS